MDSDFSPVYRYVYVFVYVYYFQTEGDAQRTLLRQDLNLYRNGSPPVTNGHSNDTVKKAVCRLPFAVSNETHTEPTTAPVTTITPLYRLLADNNGVPYSYSYSYSYSRLRG